MKMLRMRDIVAFVVVIAMVVAITPIVAFPAGVLADDNGTVNGQFTLSGGAPTLDSVLLRNNADNFSPTEMTVMTPYIVQVGVSDVNTLRDLTEVKVTIYYDSDGDNATGSAPTVGHPQTCAIITANTTDNWTTPAWYLDSGSSSFWSISASSVADNMDASTGTFDFHFTPGKVATATDGTSGWHIYAEVSDGTGSDENTQAHVHMAWYGQVDISGSVEWSGVVPGEVDKAIVTGSITENYTSNGAWYIKVAATSPWTATGESATLVTDNTPLLASQFSLKANDSDNLTAAEYVHDYTNFSNYIQQGTITLESGDQTAVNELWLSLGSPFPNGTYTGNIYYKISSS